MEITNFRFKRVWDKLMEDAENTCTMFIGDVEECFWKCLRTKNGARTAGVKKNGKEKTPKANQSQDKEHETNEGPRFDKTPSSPPEQDRAGIITPELFDQTVISFQTLLNTLSHIVTGSCASDTSPSDLAPPATDPPFEN